MSNILALATYKNPILREKSVEIKEITSDIKILIDDMIETLNDSGGVGLAAPQVNKNLRLIIVKYKDNELVLFNPEIIKKSWRKNSDEEGCLSLPGAHGIVRRHSKVIVKAKNKNFEDIKIIGCGILARIFQHEIDHLDGILFIDRAVKIMKGKKLLSENLS